MTAAELLDGMVRDMNNQAQWYVTGPDQGQCTAIAHEEEQRLGLPIVYGNAIDTYDNAPDDLYEKELNTPTGVPRPGAILVYGEYAPYHISAQYGHTGVALAGCDANTLVTLEQNWGEQVVRVHSRDYGGVMGWFYPRVLEAQPAPAPAPAPAPNPPPQAPVPPTPPDPEPAPNTPLPPPIVPTNPVPIPQTNNKEKPMNWITARYKAIVAGFGGLLGLLYMFQTTTPNKYVALAIVVLTTLGVHQVTNK